MTKFAKNGEERKERKNERTKERKKIGENENEKKALPIMHYDLALGSLASKSLQKRQKKSTIIKTRKTLKPTRGL